MGAKDRGQRIEDRGHRTGGVGIKNGATGMSDIEHVASEGMERLGKAT